MGGKDPFHATIVAYGEPTHWTQMREYESRIRDPRTVQSIEPPDPQYYQCLPESPVCITSGVDINAEVMGAGEFWAALESALEENINGEESRLLWNFGGEHRRGIGSLLCEDRELEEEKAEEELHQKMNEVESWGG